MGQKTDRILCFRLSLQGEWFYLKMIFTNLSLKSECLSLFLNLTLHLPKSTWPEVPFSWWWDRRRIRFRFDCRWWILNHSRLIEKSRCLSRGFQLNITDW